MQDIYNLNSYRNSEIRFRWVVRVTNILENRNREKLGALLPYNNALFV